jgi:membrane-associated phospholipid phosphatase
MPGFDINGSLFDWLNESAGHVAAIDHAMVWAAKYGVFAVFIIVCASWFIRTCTAEDRRLAVYTAALSALMAASLVILIQHYYVHQRPFVVRGDVVLLMRHGPDASFPSEHATAAFAMASGLGVFRPRIGLVAIVCALMVAVARVYVGVHYPADVAAGAAIGTISTLVVFAARPALMWLDRTAVVRVAPRPLL